MSDDLERVERALARQVAPKVREGVVERRQGVVDAVNTDGTVDVTVGGVIVPGVRCKAWYGPAPDDVVFVDVVGTDFVVDGPVDGPVRRPRNQEIRVPGGTSVSVAVGTVFTTPAQLQDSLWFVSGRRYRVSFLIWAAGLTATEWYFRIVVNSVTAIQEVRFSPTGGNSPSPQGAGVFTATTTGALDTRLDVGLQTGSGTLYLAGTSAFQTSWLLVEDIT